VTKKSKVTVTKLVPWQYDYNILKVPYQEFYESIEEMPFTMLLYEYRSHCEYRGNILKNRPDFSRESNTDLYNRIHAIEILLKGHYHRLNDSIEACQYWENENYNLAQKKKEVNVKVSNKSTKQTKQS
jgi:hypothetical protein